MWCSANIFEVIVIVADLGSKVVDGNDDGTTRWDDRNDIAGRPGFMRRGSVT